MKPSKTVHTEAMIVRKIKYLNESEEENCSLKDREARAMEAAKKINPMIILIFRNGVVIFLNLVFPSSNPVKKDKTIKKGRKNDITLMV